MSECTQVIMKRHFEIIYNDGRHRTASMFRLDYKLLSLNLRKLKIYVRIIRIHEIPLFNFEVIIELI